MEKRLGTLLKKLKILQKELESVQIDMDVRTPVGQEWKRKTENMHALSVQFYAAKLVAWDAIRSHIKAVSMTVDGFLQALSKQSASNRLLVGKKFTWAIIDEAHQLDFRTVAAVASQVNGILLLFDKAQEIVHHSHSNTMEKH